MKWIIQFLATIAIATWAPPGIYKAALLLAGWGLSFYPSSRRELLFFALCAAAFTAGNYGALVKQNFSFSRRDVWLMPYHEIFMWGFYGLNAVRLIGAQSAAPRDAVKVAVYAAVFSVCFSAVADEITLLAITVVLLGVGLAVFGSRRDLQYVGYFSAMGVVVEFLGLHNGLWSYPHARFFALPIWGPFMWANIGLIIGRASGILLYGSSERTRTARETGSQANS